jgi:hypothetical protein
MGGVICGEGAFTGMRHSVQWRLNEVASVVKACEWLKDPDAMIAQVESQSRWFRDYMRDRWNNLERVCQEQTGTPFNAEVMCMFEDAVRWVARDMGLFQRFMTATGLWRPVFRMRLAAITLFRAW